MVSLPRDTVNVPTAPGRVYAERINALFFTLQGGKGKRKAALDKFRDTLAYAFDTEIDYYALVEFDGLERLVKTIGGVSVDLEEPLVDPTMHYRQARPPPQGRPATTRWQGGARIHSIAAHLERLRPLASPAPGADGCRRAGRVTG